MVKKTFVFNDLTEDDLEKIFLGLDELKHKHAKAVVRKLTQQVMVQVNNSIGESAKKQPIPSRRAKK